MNLPLLTYLLIYVTTDLSSESVTDLRGTARVRLARISGLLDKRSTHQLVVMWIAVGLEDLLRVLQGCVVHRLAWQRA